LQDKDILAQSEEALAQDALIICTCWHVVEGRVVLFFFFTCCPWNESMPRVWLADWLWQQKSSCQILVAGLMSVTRWLISSV